jgi:trans-aconitate methyltransferase
MDLIEKATIMHYHRHRLSICRDGTVEALGWRGADSQLKRFAALATVVDSVSRFTGATLLDLGCGYGDLKGYLDRSCSGFTYIGIDQMAEFIAEARQRYQDCANTWFYQSDFTRVDFPEVDYVLASGALGYRCANPEFYTGMLRKMYGAARRALAFNMLDAARFPEHPLLVGHDPDAIVSFCQTLSPSVRLLRGYLEDDFTVLVYRE